MAHEPGWTVLRALDWATQELARQGFESPRLEAEVLLGHTLGMGRVDLYLHFDRPLTPQELSAFKSHLAKRLEHFPLQYITGRTQFMSSELLVCPGVFIPRPETEVLVEEVIVRLRRRSEGEAPLVIVDLGTGCGNIAISLAREFPQARVYAVDVSPEAVAIARENAVRNGVAGSIHFLVGDLFEPLKGRGLEGGVDLLVSNPPYIPRGEMGSLPPEVGLFEPREALDGGQDGMDFHRRIVAQAPDFKNPGAWLALEVGEGQAQRARSMLLSDGKFRGVEVIKDYAGIERVVIGERA